MSDAPVPPPPEQTPEEGRPPRPVVFASDLHEPLLFLHPDLRVRSANPAFYAHFAVRPEDTEGRRVYDLGNGQWDIPALRTLLEDVLPNDDVVNDFEVTHTFEHLGERVMLVNARRLDHAPLILLGIRDITERKRAEEALRESEERYRLLVESAREYAILMLDSEGRITAWSAGAERVFGYPEAEALGQPGALIFTEEDRAAGVPERELGSAAETGRANDERWHVRKDGTLFWATGVVEALYDEGGGLLGFTKVLRDNTARKAAEEALRLANETLEERVAERTREVREFAVRLTLAEQAERHRLAEILHDDLQQQLFGLSVLLNLIPEATRPEEQRELQARAAETLEAATALTRSLSTELSPPVLASDRLSELLGWLAERKREQHGLDVAVEVEEPCVVPGHETRVLLYRVLQEALFNVVKHAGSGRARVRARCEAAGVVVEVEDDGAGLDPGAVAERKLAASGFGLANVRERLRLAGGRLHVASAPGEGTRVTVTVPVGEAPPAQEKPGGENP